MASGDVRAFVRANLPDPPARVLEIGAGDGRLGRALRAVGYDVLAIDPRSQIDDVRAVALADLNEPAGSFAAGQRNGADVVGLRSRVDREHVVTDRA